MLDGPGGEHPLQVVVGLFNPKKLFPQFEQINLSFFFFWNFPSY